MFEKSSNLYEEIRAFLVGRLEEILDGYAECFPFETIDELKQEIFPD